jgi:hypothetical protein
MPNHTVSHLRRPSPQRVFCFALGLAFYPTCKHGGQHEESKQSAGAPYLESCHASHRLNCEQTNKQVIGSDNFILQISQTYIYFKYDKYGVI